MMLLTLPFFRIVAFATLAAGVAGSVCVRARSQSRGSLQKRERVREKKTVEVYIDVSAPVAIIFLRVFAGMLVCCIVFTLFTFLLVGQGLADCWFSFGDIFMHFFCCC